MICPKGYAMGSNGVCQQGNGYAYGGLMRNQAMSRRRPGGGNSRSECLDNCHDMMGQYNSCMMGNDTGGPCSCTDIPYNYQAPNGDYVVTFQQMCNWNGASPGQCYSNCFGGGRRAYGRAKGGQGTNRRMGGPIRRRRRRR